MAPLEKGLLRFRARRGTKRRRPNMRKTVPFLFVVMAILRPQCGWAAIITTAADAGGGIKNNGTLTLDRVILSGNSAGGGQAGKSGFGGGLDNEDFMTVSNSRIDNNLAVGGANANGIGGGMNNRLGTATLI